MTRSSFGTRSLSAARRSVRSLVARLGAPLAALGLGVLAAPLPAQQLAEGLASSATTLPGATSLALRLPQGVVTFDGLQVQATMPGQAPQTLLTLSAFRFGSFLLPVGNSHVLFGCTGLTGGDAVWLVPLQGPAPAQPLAALAFNYDAALLDAGRALVSARTGGFSAPDNELWVLDLATGGLQRIASIAGASGPVAIAGNGDVYYATGFAGFPTPPGTCSVMRFPRAVIDAAIANNQLLGMPQVQTIAAGLDAAGDLCFDDDGDLLFVDWFNGRIGEISDAASASPTVVPNVVDFATAGVYPTTVQFVAGAQAGVFEPFQPANGALYVFETDYVAAAALRRVESRPATLLANASSPAPAGPLPLVVTAGPANGLGLLAFGVGAPGGPTALAVPGFEAPLLWDAALLPNPVLLPFVFDATGGAVVTLQNPGFATPFAALVQIALVSTQARLGATAALPLTIGQ